MMLARLRLIPPRIHIVVVVGVTFAALLIAAGVRAAPGVLMLPLQQSFHWDRATISFAAAVGIFLYGLVGPFAAALMQSIGIRRTMIGGLTLIGVATFLSQWMTAPWQYILSWGVVSGIGTGTMTAVLGAAVVNRWFAARQGLVMGLLSASTATGALVFLPVLAWLSRYGDWRPVVLAVSLTCAALIPIVVLFFPERPADIGAVRFGETPDHQPAPRPPVTLTIVFTALARAVRTSTFWVLFGTFFICGLTTSGLVATHMIAYCGDHGIAPVAGAGVLSLMGVFDLIGTTASGWLTDRYDSRRLLVIYYGLRGISLIILPFLSFSPISLMAFAVFYGLDWIATVPPTLKLTNQAFGERDAPVVFGWILVGHQAGAATAAFGAGLVRQLTGAYLPAFLGAGVLAVLASIILIATPRLLTRPAV